MAASARSWLGALAVLGACHAAPAPGTPSAGDDDLAGLYDAASEHAQRGDRDGALALLERLDARGWSFGPTDRDLPGLAELPRYRALSARMKARGPKVLRATPAMTIADPALAPEGIAYDDDRGAVFVGSMAQHKIVRIDPAGAPRDFATHDSGLDAVLGLRVDAAHHLLWAASTVMAGLAASGAEGAALFAFDLETGELRGRWPVPGSGGAHLLNDVAIAPDGTAYVTDTAAGAVWRHAPAALGLSVMVQAGGLRYPNGIACDATHVLVAHARGVAVITPATGARVELAVPAGATLAGLDGLYLDGDALLGIQNGLGSARVVRAELDATHTRATRIRVLESAHPALDMPTTAALVRRERRLLVLVPGDPQLPIVLSVPIDP